jgi:uncharacterized protein with PQ loop repeat
MRSCQNGLVIDAIGYLASVGALLMWLPQGWRVITHQHEHAMLEGVSVVAYSTGFLFNALLLVYGIGTSGIPIVAAACVNLVMSSLIVIVVSRSRAKQ